MTSAQRERCRKIAAQLDAGDQRAWLRAESSLTVEERGAIWDLRRPPVAGNGVMPIGIKSTAHVEKDLRSHDLDFWGDTEPDDNDDDMPIDDGETGRTTEQKICSRCHGSGFDSGGARCSFCLGTGRTPQPQPPSVDDVEEDDEDNGKPIEDEE